MFNYKRALTLWLGLFFYLLFPLGAQESSSFVTGEISAGAGTLWVEDEGAAFYWQSGITLNLGNNLFFGFDFIHVTSNLPWFDSSIFGYMGHFGIDTSGGGFTLTCGFFNHPQLNAGTDDFYISNEGGQGYYFSVETPLRFNLLNITPHFLYGKADWENGDIYWFFGKPIIPSLMLYGFTINFESPRYYRHGLGFFGLSADVRIISNDNESLFNAGLNAGLFFYQFLFENERTSFSGTLGWMYANAFFEGALTSSNQPFFLFPYIFYNVNASINAQAGFALLHFQHTPGIFRYSINLGVFHVFYDQTKIDLHYRMKRLFGGQENSDEIHPDIKGIGAAILVFNAAFPAIPLTGNKNLFLGLEKVFALPWGFSSDDSIGGGIPSETDLLSLIRTILLSGLSVRASFSW